MLQHKNIFSTDSNIIIDGGIWDNNSKSQSALATGSYGVFCLLGVGNLIVKNVTIKNTKGSLVDKYCKAFGCL